MNRRNTLALNVCAVSMLCAGQTAFAQSSLSTLECDALIANTVQHAEKIATSDAAFSLATYALYRRFVQADIEDLKNCNGGDEAKTLKQQNTARRKIRENDTLFDNAKLQAASYFGLSETATSRGSVGAGRGNVGASDGGGKFHEPLDILSISGGSVRSTSADDILSAFLQNDAGASLSSVIDADEKRKVALTDAFTKVYERRVQDFTTFSVDIAAPDNGAPKLVLAPKDKKLHEDFWGGLVVELAQETKLEGVDTATQAKAFSDLKRYLDENTRPLELSIDGSVAINPGPDDGTVGPVTPDPQPDPPPDPN